MIAHVALGTDSKHKLGATACAHDVSMSEMVRKCLMMSFIIFPRNVIRTSNPYLSTVSFYIDDDCYHDYRKHAECLGISFSEYTRRALEEYL